MNIYRSILKMSVISFVLLGNIVLFGMRCDCKGTLNLPKPDRIKILAPETKEYLVDYLDNPIVFGQTNKENHGLVKDQGLRNICLAYKTNDPSFVLSHYVPILLIDSSNKRDFHDFRCINSYKLVKMSNNFYFKESLIIPLRNKRLDQALEQKKIQYGHDKVKFDSIGGFYHVSPLAEAVLFGNDEDILHELNVLRNDKHFSMVGNISSVHGAICALIHYPSVNHNNALEILVSIEKEMRPSNFCSNFIAMFFYQLLFTADKAKNKKVFKALVDKDPLDAINIVWVDPYAKNRLEVAFIKPNTPLTTLDRMIEEGGFDPENIALLQECSGKTMKELKTEI